MEKKMSEENKKSLKEYHKKNAFHKCKCVNKNVLQRYFLFVLLLIFER